MRCSLPRLARTVLGVPTLHVISLLFFPLGFFFVLGSCGAAEAPSSPAREVAAPAPETLPPAPSTSGEGPPEPLAAPPPCALALSNPPEGSFDDRLAESEAALRACGATDVRSDVSHTRTGAVVRGTVGGVVRGVLVLPIAATEIAGDAPLEATLAYTLDPVPLPGALRLAHARLASDRVRASDGIAFLRTTTGVVARSFACPEGNASVATRTACGTVVACSGDGPVLLAVHSGEIVTTSPCLEAWRAAAGAALEAFRPVRDAYDAVRAPVPPECPVDASARALFVAELRSALGERAIDELATDLESLPLECADASGARLVVLDRDLTTQRVILLSGGRARTIFETTASVSYHEEARVELSGGAAPELIFRETRELGDEGAHTRERYLVVGTSLAEPIELPRISSGRRSRAVTLGGGLAFVGEDGVYAIDGDRFVPVPADEEVTRILALRDAYRERREPSERLLDLLLRPVPGGPDCDASWRAYDGARATDALVELGLSADRAAALGAPPFLCHD